MVCDLKIQTGFSQLFREAAVVNPFETAYNAQILMSNVAF